MLINELDFRQTCGACPEQYDVYDMSNKQVGYVRLRWGHLTADYSPRGKLVYEFSFEDGWLGTFPDESERAYHLGQIANALTRQINIDNGVLNNG